MAKFNLNTDKKVIILYVLIGLVVILFSLIGLFFNIYEITLVFSLTFFFSFFTLLLNLYLSKKEEKDGVAYYLVFGLLRFLCLASGLIISGVIIHFTSSNEDDNYRFLYLLLGLFPIFISNFLYYIRSKDA